MQTFPIVTFGSIIPMEHPDAKIASFELLDGLLEVREEVGAKIVPILERIGFYQKTEFESLCVCIEFATQEQVIKKELMFHNYKAHKMFNITKRFVWKNEYEKSLSQWNSFLLTEVGQIVLLVCSKYSLDVNVARDELDKLGTVCQVIDISGPSTESEPVEITVRFPFKSLEDLDLNLYFDMEEQLEKAFSKSKKGRVDGHSFESNCFEIYCVGHESERMQKIISKTFASLQQGYEISILTNNPKSV